MAEADDAQKHCLARLLERARHEDHNSQALRLANGYLRDEPSPGDDDILSRIARQDLRGDLEVSFWRDMKQLEEQLASAMKQHLNLTDDAKVYVPFNESIGLSTSVKPEDAEHWQILSPVRNHEYGTADINRRIQDRYRGGMLNHSRRSKVKPFGEQEIVYTDKVMQTINRRKTGYLKGEALDYVANGEIGLVVQTTAGNGRPDSIKVQFSTQPASHYYYPGQVSTGVGAGVRPNGP